MTLLLVQAEQSLFDTDTLADNAARAVGAAQQVLFSTPSSSDIMFTL